MRNPYQVLGVGREAGDAEIKKAYRKLAKKLHPDVNPGDTAVEQRFKEVSQAYAILGDKEKRGRFDRGEIDESGQERSFAHGFHQQGGRRRSAGFDFQGFRPEDILSELFGGGQRRQGQAKGRGGASIAKGADIKTRITVPFLDAVRGTTKKLRGTDGKILEIKIPPGTDDGQVLRLQGKGKPGVGGKAGNLLVEIGVTPHPHFTRKDRHIYLELPVTLQEALLGAEVEIPTLEGKVSLKIPAGSNSGTTLRLKGKGLKASKAGEAAGDFYVRLKLVLPDKPDRKLKDFVKSWGDAHSYNPRKASGLED